MKHQPCGSQCLCVDATAGAREPSSQCTVAGAVGWMRRPLVQQHYPRGGKTAQPEASSSPRISPELLTATI